MLIIFIILGIIMIIVGIIVYSDCGDGTCAILGAMLGALIGLIPSFLIGGIISIALLGLAPMECKYTQDLIAMKDNTVISGSFFLGSGRIDSDMCYVYMIDTDKGMTTKTIKQATNHVYIKHTDGQPYMEYWDGVDDPWRFADESAYYVFYLPEGSVVNTFEIDLE